MIKSYGFWFLEYDFKKNFENEDFKTRREKELYYDYNRKKQVKREEYAEIGIL